MAQTEGAAPGPHSHSTTTSQPHTHTAASGVQEDCAEQALQVGTATENGHIGSAECSANSCRPQLGSSSEQSVGSTLGQASGGDAATSAATSAAAAAAAAGAQQHSRRDSSTSSSSSSSSDSCDSEEEGATQRVLLRVVPEASLVQPGHKAACSMPLDMNSLQESVEGMAHRQWA